MAHPSAFDPPTASDTESKSWRVMLASDDIKMMSLGQLDDAYRLSVVDDDTEVWGPGMAGWQRLGVVLGEGGSRSAPPPARQSAPPPARSAPPPPPLSQQRPVRSTPPPPILSPTVPPRSAPPPPVLSATLPPRSSPPPSLRSRSDAPPSSSSIPRGSIPPPPRLVPTHPPAPPSRPAEPELVRSAPPPAAVASQPAPAFASALASAPAPIAPSFSSPPSRPEMLLASSTGAAFEPAPARHPRRGRAVGWFVGTVGMMGLFVVLYRSHALLAAARAVSLEGRYLSIEQAASSRLRVILGREQQAPAVAPSPPATGLVASSDRAQGASSVQNQPELAAPAAPASAAPQPPVGDDDRGSSPPEKELVTTESPETGSKKSVPRHGRPAKAGRTSAAKKGEPASDASDDEETPKSHSSQTVSLDEEADESPKSLWPTKARKAAASKSDSAETHAKERVEPPPVDSTLNDAIRAASQK